MSLVYLSSHRVPRPAFRSRPARRARSRWPRALGLGVAALGGALLLSMAEGLRDPSVASAAPEVGASALAGRPTRITDGDTFRLGEVRVRLHGVNAPELRTPDGQPARRHLVGLIGDDGVRCADTGQRSYERVVATCWSAAGRELGATMVADGWALDAPRFSGGRYAADERAARRAGRGMHAGA